MNLRTRELQRFFMIHRMPDHNIGSQAGKVYPCFTGTVGRAIGLLPFSVVEIALYALILAVVLRIIRAFARLILSYATDAWWT